MNKKYGALSSSVNPQELAKTVEGILKIVGGLAVYYGLASHMDVDEVIGQVVQLITIAFTAYGLLESVYGIARKILVNIQAKF